VSDKALKGENKMSELSSPIEKPGILDHLANFFTRAIDQSDITAATERVAALRAAYPDASVDELVDMLITQKCVQTGSMAALTSGIALVPGLGTAISLILGTSIDIGLTFKWQTELVLEIAAVHNRLLGADEKRNVVLLITGLSVSTTQLAKTASRNITRKIMDRITNKFVSKVIPIMGVGISGSANVLTTYLIGQRAHAYFQIDPESIDGWVENLRALIGIDEQKTENIDITL
jgi:hypothetical protein